MTSASARHPIALTDRRRWSNLARGRSAQCPPVRPSQSSSSAMRMPTSRRSRAATRSRWLSFVMRVPAAGREGPAHSRCGSTARCRAEPTGTPEIDRKGCAPATCSFCSSRASSTGFGLHHRQGTRQIVRERNERRDRIYLSAALDWTPRAGSTGHASNLRPRDAKPFSSYVAQASAAAHERTPPTRSRTLPKTIERARRPRRRPSKAGCQYVADVSRQNRGWRYSDTEPR